MNKLILPILLLAAVLLVSGCTRPPEDTTNKVELSVGDAEGLEGQEVEVSVNLKTNGLEPTALQFDLHFDSQLAESAEIEPGLMTLSADKMFDSNIEVEEGHLRVVIASLNNLPIGDGEIAKIKFKLKEGSALKTTYELKLDEVEVVNKDAEKLGSRTTDGSIFGVEVYIDPTELHPCLLIECNRGNCVDGRCIPENTVEMSSTGFSPNSLTVKAGDTITFVSKEGQHWPASAMHPTHTVYPESGGCIGSKFDACKGLAEGESWSFVFNEEGTWKYHDHLSSSLTGTIVVE